MDSLGVSKSTPTLGDLLALSMELYFLMAGIHHRGCKDTQTGYKGKRLQLSLEVSTYRLPRFPPLTRLTQIILLSDKNAATRVPCFYSGKLTGDSAPKDFPGGWSHRHPLPGTYPNPRLTGKEVCWSGFPRGTDPQSYRMRWRGDF